MSVSSAIVSFFSYFQNLSVNIKLPHITFPSWFTDLLDGINNFIAKIQTYMLQVPAFDMRTQLVLMSVAIPLLLDIIFIWFVQPFHQTILNILDNCSIFFVLFLCAYGYTIHWSLAVKILIGIFAAYLLIRLFCSLKNSSQSYQMIRLARDICAHYMFGIIPEIKIEYSIDDLNNTIQRYSKVVEIKPQPHKVYITVNFFIVFLISLFASLYFFKVFPFLQPKLSKQLNLLLAIIFIIISIVCLIVFFLRIFEKGRNFIMKFKQFCKRWGLRILMLCFDLMYIPIATTLISHINIKKFSPCPAGQYLYQVPDNYSNAMISYLITHDSYCVPCNFTTNFTNYDRCTKLCSGEIKFRPIEEPSLDFLKDILFFSGGFVLWAFVFVIVGIPLLWFCVIQQNRQFAFVVNVYGKDPTSKWIRIVNRMKTTGIFLFVNYKYSNSRWSVLYLLVKFIVMILSTIASRFYKYLSISLSFVYLFIFVGVVAVRPYLYTANNVLDSILYFAQFIFSLNSSLALFKINVPEIATSVVSVVITVVPVLSMVFLLFFRKKKADFENDPTYPQKLTDEEEESLERKRRRAKEKIKKEKSACLSSDKSYDSDEDEEEEDDDDFVIEEEEYNENNNKDEFLLDDVENVDHMNNNNANDDINQPLLESKMAKKNEKKKKVEEPGIELQELDESEVHVCFIPEDEYEVQPGDLCNINQSIARMKRRKTKKKKVQPEDAEKSFIVNKRILTNRMVSMYEMLDIVVDGSTIEILTNVLNIAIICGFAAFGWYVGKIYSNNGIEQQPICHTL